ncbi:MAG: 30S ribosomal protein S12 methylthiotransferase RimO, partial [Poseidonibacter sp.]
RGKGVEKLNELMDHMKSKPNSFVRTTFIAGHPGETQEDHEALCEYIANYKFDRANVFSYSTEEGTAAAKSDALIDQETIDKRADEIGEIIAQTTQESLEKEVGKTFEVYIDGESDEHEFLLSARKTTWAPDIDGEIYINDNELYDENNPEQLAFGQIYTVKVTELSGDKLLATVIK